MGCLSDSAVAQVSCAFHFEKPLSARPANYEIQVALQDSNHTLKATQRIHFVNQTPVAILYLRFYLYFNAFKNTETSFLRGTSKIFGQDFLDRSAEDWGWIHVDRIGRANGADLTAGMRFVRPDDGNPADQSVLEVALERPLLPGDTAVLDLQWRAQIPKTISRAGRNKDFYFLCHWFPQLGVFEQSPEGKWHWNCHQFFRTTEFYADFGVYDVHITTPDRYVTGASGCMVNERKNNNGTTTRHYHAEDVIDFAWVACPRLLVQEQQWKDVHIRLLIPPEHADLGPRYLKALVFALEYMEQHVGKYPYPIITVVDPPFYGLQSGLMEYPTLITAGTFYKMPASIRTMESLVIHEFLHQYFMGMVASNEKEEPWLDEGFVTYFEDRVLDAAYGRKHALIAFPGFHLDNREQTRLEYVTMQHPRSGMSGQPGWMFDMSNFKALIYSKPATTLHTLEALLGTPSTDVLMRTYFDRWKFRHPRGRDFMAHLENHLSQLPDTLQRKHIYQLVQTSIYGAKVLDYAVTDLKNEVLPAPQGIFGDSMPYAYKDGSGESGNVAATVEVQRLGDWVFPVEIAVFFEDGSQENVYWSGEEGKKTFVFLQRGKVVSACIDPDQKMLLDVDLNNNSRTLEPRRAPLWKYASRVLFAIQRFMQFIA